MKNLICVSAPSGSGKTTLCKAVRKARPELIWSVSYTTRDPRPNEVNGEDYYFINNEEFEIKDPPIKVRNKKYANMARF